MTIKELYNSKKITVRSYNVCIENNIVSIEDLFSYRVKNKSFTKLRNCGRKSNIELESICDDFANIIIEKKPIINIYELNRDQREIINNYIKYRVEKLSVRSKNGLSQFLDYNFSIRNIYDKILSKQSFYFADIDNIGDKSIIELDEFLEYIIQYVNLISQVSNESKLLELKNRFFIESNFQLSNIPDEVIKSNSIFTLTNYIIDNSKLFTENKENIIMVNGMNIYNNKQPLNLDELSKIIKLTRERTRQIRKRVMSNLYDKFSFIRFIDDDLYKNYKIDINESIIEINNELSDNINELCNTNFTKEFIAYLIYVYLNNNFSLLGDVEEVFVKKEKNTRFKYISNKFYLLNKQFNEFIDIENLMNDIYSKLNDKIEETYTLNIKTYIYRFLNQNNIDIIKNLLPIIERILFNEFGLNVDINDNIVFERNTLKQVPEYAAEILDELGKPSRIDEIYDLLENEFPGMTKSQESLRGSLQRSTEIIYFGRSSTYGLKKW